MNTKLQTYISIVKINAKQLVNAMKIANETNDKYLLANVIDDVVKNIIDFNIPYNLLIGDIIDTLFVDDDIYIKYENGELSSNDFVPNITNYIDPQSQIDYLQSLPNECIDYFDEWVKTCKLSLYSSNSLLITIFGDFTTLKYIWNDKNIMGAN